MPSRESRVIRVHDKLVLEIEDYQAILSKRYGRQVSFIEASHELGKRMKEQKDGARSAFGIFS